MYISIIYGIVCLGAFVFCAVIIIKMRAHLAVRIRRDRNNDQAAAKWCRELIDEAKKDMIIHDDGNNTCQTLYNNTEVLKAIKLCLDGGTTIRILFTRREDIKLAQLEHRNLQIYYCREASPKPDLHYKIVDRGRMACLSRHAEHEERKDYELIDCRRTPRTGRKMFADLYQKFEDEISAAEPAEVNAVGNR